MNEPIETSPAQPRGGICVLIALSRESAGWASCRASVEAHTPTEHRILEVEPTTAAVNGAISETAAADVVILDGACNVSSGWIERLRDSVRADTNTATASALADACSPLAVGEGPSHDFSELTARVAARTRRVRPRLRHAVGPCVYVRREAFELVGLLDERLELRAALELDFARRCLLSGLAHVAADDVLVEILAPEAASAPLSVSPLPRERLANLPENAPLGESEALADVLRSTQATPERLSVTIDARALDGAVTGTQVHILELVRALAATDALHLRVLIRSKRIDADTLALLEQLPGTEVLAEEQLGAQTPPSTVYHRPQQAFAAEDVALAVRLGERIVLSQLDLIAYRNPAYFPDADSWEDYRRAGRRGISAAERVVVFSEHTRQELLSDGLADASRIRVVPPGLDHRAASGEERPQGLDEEASVALAEGFLLCLGTDFRHKNRLFALRLLAALRREHGWPGVLVLAGAHIPHGSSLELEHAYLEAHPELHDAVLTLASIDEREKAWLLARASAVVYPSVYEGFGLVPFESGLAGVPCLFAPQSSLAEAAPAHTATIVPWDPIASATAAHELLADGQARVRHVQALADAARALTWSAAALALVEIYREAAQAPSREAATLSRDTVRGERRLTEAHEAVVRRLIGEREHAQRMYDELNAEVGSGLSLIGPNGALPEDAQRALLGISAHPRLRRPLFGALARVFVAGRALGRALAGARRPPR